MPCGGCAKRRAAAQAARKANEEKDLMGGYANLTDRQIKARLENYKRRYCKECTKRYECDYVSYVNCKSSNSLNFKLKVKENEYQNLVLFICVCAGDRNDFFCCGFVSDT